MLDRDLVELEVFRKYSSLPILLCSRLTKNLLYLALHPAALIMSKNNK